MPRIGNASSGLTTLSSIAVVVAESLPAPAVLRRRLDIVGAHRRPRPRRHLGGRAHPRGDRADRRDLRHTLSVALLVPGKTRPHRKNVTSALIISRTVMNHSTSRRREGSAPIGEGLGTYGKPFSAHRYRDIQRELSHVTLQRACCRLRVSQMHGRHCHRRSWDDLTDQQRNAFSASGLTDRRRRLLRGDQ